MKYRSDKNQTISQSELDAVFIALALIISLIFSCLFVFLSSEFYIIYKSVTL